MKKNLLFLAFSLFLTGCGSPKNSEIALMGLMGAWGIFLTSFLTLFIFTYFTDRKRNFIIFFFKKYKILVYMQFGLLVINLLIPLIIGEYLNAEIIPIALFMGFTVVILGGAATILYTFILLFILKRYNKYYYLVPILIIIFYIATLWYVYKFDFTHNDSSLLQLWIWPMYILAPIFYSIDKII